MTILNAKVLPKAGHNKASLVSEKKIRAHQAGRDGVEIHGTVCQATNVNHY